MSKARRIVSSEDQKNKVLEKIKYYQEKGFPEAAQIHELVMESAPNLHPRLWYGMPGYAKSKDSAVLFFFRKDKYISFGVTESIKITDDPDLIPTSWFAFKLSKETKEKIVDTVQRATK